MTQHKYNLGIIGNCAFSGLVDKQAMIRWMCWPRFDSSFIFGSLLDEENGGHFSIQPEWDTYESKQQYVYNTNVIETHFDCEDGQFKVIDFAPRFMQYDRFYKPLMLIRKVVPVKGRPRIRVSCKPVGDHGETIPEMEFGSSHIRFKGLESQVRLTTNIPLSYIEEEQAFVLNDVMFCVLTWGTPLEGPLESTVEGYLKKTIDYWRTWVKNTSVENFHQEAVIRSALAIKLHQYQETGAMISSTTTSLPQYPGTSRNWDYRYCWLREAHYTIKALNELSHFGILQHYTDFIENIVLGEDKRFRPVYSITIDKDPVERNLPLEGYNGERPVRIGNQSFEHTQNDVYGQVLVTLLPMFSDKRLVSKESLSLVGIVKQCLDMIQETLDETDHGPWEFRGITQQHTYTFLFHWAGANAARKIARIIKDDQLEAQALDLIQSTSDKIETCYDSERGVYTQAIGSDYLDASSLQLINMGYLDANSEKARKHLVALEEELRTESGLFHRYTHDDDFGKMDSNFLVCAYWYVEALARTNRIEEAISIFENLLKYSNHLGLQSEDAHEASGSQYGNFPQTSSHVGLINAAFVISRKLDKPVFL